MASSYKESATSGVKVTEGEGYRRRRKLTQGHFDRFQWHYMAGGSTHQGPIEIGSTSISWLISQSKPFISKLPNLRLNQTVSMGLQLWLEYTVAVNTYFIVTYNYVGALTHSVI